MRARTASSASARSSAWTSSASMVDVTALSFSGRCSVIVQTPSSTSYRTSLAAIADLSVGDLELDAPLAVLRRDRGRRGGEPEDRSEEHTSELQSQSNL